MATRVVVGLGSNLGDRAGHVAQALAALESLAVGPVAASSIYVTDPQDMEDDSEEFANAAAAFDTVLDAHALLDALQSIEEDLGRPRDHAAYVSRTIDLDIITYGNERIDSAALTVPHPRAAARAFVLMPIVEIAPETQIDGRPAMELLAALLE